MTKTPASVSQNARRPHRKNLIRRAASPATGAAPMPPAVLKEALLLLEGLRVPSDAAYTQARDILNAFATRPPASYPTHGDTLLFLLSCALSGRSLPGYATLDPAQIHDIERVVSVIKRYLDDQSQKRPLNLLMLASPGAGKSHLIQCIAEQLGTQAIGAITYNMVSLERNEDLIPPLEAARNLKVTDRIPLLFLDEFDAQPAHYPLLLPLLWDGQLTVGQHELKLGKIVVVLAGSDPRLPDAVEYARSMKPKPPQLDTNHPKLVDLLSRINGGVLRIPQLSDPARAAERRADKVCITLNLLRQRFGKQLRRVPITLLRFIANTEFRYGVRSIAHLIDLIPYKRAITSLTVPMLHLPVRDEKDLKASSLAYHLLHEDQAGGIVRAWREVNTSQSLIPIGSGMLEYFSDLIRELPPQYLSDFALPRLWEDVTRASNAHARRRGGLRRSARGV